jgi:hypothetical protein
VVGSTSAECGRGAPYFGHQEKVATVRLWGVRAGYLHRAWSGALATVQMLL